jgi:hypothetical protein
MRFRVVLAAKLFAVAGCSGPGASAPEPSRAAVLVGLLAPDDPGVRRDAEAALSRMGEEAREALRAALGSTDAEVAARARALYRPLAVSRLELSLRAEPICGPCLWVSCFLKNPDVIPLVAVRSHFHEVTRVKWSLDDPEGSPPVWKWEVWTHLCSDVHPFEERDFVVLPPGETRYVGWIELSVPSLAAGRHRLVGKYEFRRPEEIDARYFTDARLHRLYLDAVEVDGILSAPIEIEIPTPP